MEIESPGGSSHTLDWNSYFLISNLALCPRAQASRPPSYNVHIEKLQKTGTQCSVRFAYKKIRNHSSAVA